MNIDRAKIQKAITDFLTEFGKQYAKAFTIALIQDILKGKGSEEKEERQLRTFVPTPPDLEGTVKFSADGSAKFTTRYFKVTDKWEIAVWADEKKKSEKPKEVLSMYDYSVWWWSPPEKEFPKRRGGPKWVSDKDRKECSGCKKAFNLTARRHHCRTCGEVFCDTCTSSKYSLNELGYVGPQRVCKPCYEKLNGSGLDAFKFPDEKSDTYGVQLTHWYRSGLYFVVPDSDTQWKWIYGLRDCARYAKSPANENPIQAAAFAAAHRYVWNRQGPWWRWWNVFGSEVEMLTELLGFILERSIVPDLLSDMKIRNSKVDALVSKTVKEMVGAGVAAAWPKTLEQVTKGEAVLREKLTPLLAPIGEAERKLKDSIKTGISEPITSVLKTVANPITEKILPLMFKPLLNSHIQSYAVLKNLIDFLKKEIKEQKTKTVSDFKYQLRRAMWQTWYWSGNCSLYGKIVEPELYPLEENLRKLGKVPPFTYLSPWRVRWEIQSAIEQLWKDALYTIETEESIVKEIESGNLEEAIAKFYPTLANRYYHDSVLIVNKTTKNIFMDLILTPLQKGVEQAPGVKSTIEEVQKAIPETLHDFIDIQKDFDELLEGVVTNVVNELVDGNKSSLGELRDGFAKNAGATTKDETPTEETEVVTSE